jgi:hypothetical protein
MPNSSFANLSNMLVHSFVFGSLNMSNREAKRVTTFGSIFRMATENVGQHRFVEPGGGGPEGQTWVSQLLKIALPLEYL